MILIKHQEMMCEYIFLKNKWAVYLSWDPDETWDEISEACPTLRTLTENDRTIFLEESTLIICDSEKEARDIFESTVGDDGPTETNKYNGTISVYAMIINPFGEILTENT